MKRHALPFLVIGTSIMAALAVAAAEPARFAAPTPSPSYSRPATPPAQKKAEDDEVIKIETTLVQMPVRAVRLDGKGAGELKLEDLEITIDGKKGTIDGLYKSGSPFVASVLLDVSSSAAPYIQSALIPFSEAFVGKLKDEDRLQIYTFGSSPRPILNQFTAGTREGRSYINQRLQTIAMREGTAFLDTLGFGVAETQVASPIQNKAVILISDGKENRSSEYSLKGILSALEETKTAVYVIDLANGEFVESTELGRTTFRRRGAGDNNPGVMQRIADTSGGKWIKLEDISGAADGSLDPGILSLIMQEIMNDLRVKQLFAFEGSDLDQSVSHTIKLSLTPSGRARLKDAKLVYAPSICLSAACRGDIELVLKGQSPGRAKELAAAQGRVAQIKNTPLASFTKLQKNWTLTKKLEADESGFAMLSNGAGGFDIVPWETAKLDRRFAQASFYVRVQSFSGVAAREPLSLDAGETLTSAVEQPPAVYVRSSNAKAVAKIDDFATFVDITLKKPEGGWIIVRGTWPSGSANPDTFQDEIISAVSKWARLQ